MGFSRPLLPLLLISLLTFSTFSTTSKCSLFCARRFPQKGTRSPFRIRGPHFGSTGPLLLARLAPCHAGVRVGLLGKGRASKQAAQAQAPTLALAALAALATGALDGSRSCGKATPVVECGISDSGLTSTLGSCESDEASYHWQRFRAKLPGGGFCSITRAVWEMCSV